jgi:phosphoribosylpyrophosphate synthetase
LALRSAAQADFSSPPREERRFEGGEFKLRPLQSVRDRPTFVPQSLAGSVDMPVPVAEGLNSLIHAAAIDRVVVTDSIGVALPTVNPAGKLHTLSIAPLLGQALRRMLAGQSLAPLLTCWPPPIEGH